MAVSAPAPSSHDPNTARICDRFCRRIDDKRYRLVVFDDLFLYKQQRFFLPLCALVTLVIYWIFFFFDLFNPDRATRGVMQLAALWPLLSICAVSVVAVVIAVTCFARQKKPLSPVLLRWGIMILQAAVIAHLTFTVIWVHSLIDEGTPHLLLPLVTLPLLALLPHKKTVPTIILLLLCGAGVTLVSIFPRPAFYPLPVFVFAVFALCYVFVLVRAIRFSREDARDRSEYHDLIIESYMDFLTHTFNRQALDRYFKKLAAENKKTAGVLILDIDDFKLYNDSASHRVGDATLQHVADCVTEVAEELGLFVFRYGGEEFVLVLENPDERSLIRLGVDIRKKIWDMHMPRHDGSAFERVTVTVGGAVETAESDEELDLSDLILSADKQLYIGKKNGKNCTVYKNHMYK